MKQCPQTGRWHTADGRILIKNTFRESDLVWIDVTSFHWTANYNGQRFNINWKSFSFSKSLVEAIKVALGLKLEKCAPSTMQKYCSLCASLEDFHLSKYAINEQFLLDIDAIETLWRSMESGSRILFRSTYIELLSLFPNLVDQQIAEHLKSWKARSNVLTLRNVLEWDPENGAMTTAELETLRQALHTSACTNDIRTLTAVIILKIYISTFRRAQQLAQMRSDALKVVQTSTTSPKEYFLEVPKTKNQINEPNCWEQIPTELGELIVRYSAISKIKKLQDENDRLIVSPSKLGTEKKLKSLSSQELRAIVQEWADNNPIISPRTKTALKINQRRIRHTGATQMARQGYSRQVIQDMLQHDSSISADSYIDAIAADLVPLYEQVDRKLGGTFTSIKSAFFKGHLTDEPKESLAPIITPNPSSPSIIGQCGLGSVCPKNPVFSCYSGCPHFYAFRDADHGSVLKFLEEEHERWRDADAGKTRNRAMKDFERVAAGVLEVIDLIGEQKK